MINTLRIIPLFGYRVKFDIVPRPGNRRLLFLTKKVEHNSLFYQKIMVFDFL